MKRIICAVFLLWLTVTFFSCSEGDLYRNDLPCAEILIAAEKQIPVDMGYEDIGVDHIKYNFDETALDDDHAFRYSKAAEDINEIGIFHAPDVSSRKELERLTKGYLETTLEEKGAFIASYAPRELEKLKKAEVRTFGNYVVYAILAETDRNVFFDTVEKMLENK